MLWNAKRWLLLAFSGCWLVAVTWAQPRTLGGTFDSTQYTQQPRIERVGGVKGDAYPKAVSLRPFCPTPADQGKISGCTGYATGYGAMTLTWALKQRLTDSTHLRQEAFSAAFIYNQAKKKKGDCAEGLSMETALRLLKEKGNCMYRVFDAAGDCQKQPDSILLEVARAHRLRDFATVLPPNSPAALVVETLRGYLRDSVPLILVIKAYRQFVSMPKGTKLWRKRADEPLLGLHSVVLTGYDEQKRTFEVMSSWGTQWADGGFCQIGYEDIGDCVLGGYVLLFRPTRAALQKTVTPAQKGSLPIGQSNTVGLGAPTLARLSVEGALNLVRIDTDADDPFIEEKVRWDGVQKLYRPVRGAFPVGTDYQLRTHGIPAGQYCYVFSVDARGKATLHFPKPYISALSPGPNAVLAIPSAQSVLRLMHAGEDVVCVLYAEEPLQYIETQVQAMRQTTAATIWQRLHEIFNIDASNNDIQYNMHQLQAALATTKPNPIVPIVLCLSAQ